VTGGERELRTTYLPPFERACLDALAIMTAYSSYDGIPAVANSRTSSYAAFVSGFLKRDLFRSLDGYREYNP